MKYKLTTIIIILTNIFSQQLNPCIPAINCLTSRNEMVQCSFNGKCFFDPLLYYNSKKTQPYQTCICDEGWVTLPNSKKDDVMCCYKQKSQFMAFLLEFLFGFGFGHFYIGNYFMGSLKCCTYIFICCVSYLIIFCFCIKNDRHSSFKYERTNANETVVKFYSSPLSYKIFNAILISCILVYVIWQMTDIFMFGLNFFNDGNDVPLFPW